MRFADRLRWPLGVLFLLLPLSCGDQRTPAETDGPQGTSVELDRASDQDNEGGPRIPFDEAEVFFEFNTTDNDLGLQVFLDAEGWTKVSVSGPDKEEIVRITTEGNLSELGITELRFESAEPSPAEVLALFPRGTYRFRGRTVEGERLASTARLSHDFLPAPTFSPSDGEEVDPNDTVVEWNAPGAERVQIIIEQEDLGEFFDVIVSEESGELDVPPQFLRPDTEYKIEILAIAENGNRTIAESTFVTP
jgi:hypothetical protein